MFISNKTFANCICTIENRRIKLILMILSIFGIISNSGLAFIFAIQELDFDGIGKLLSVSILKGVIVIIYLLLVLKAYITINKINKEPDLYMNYLISYFPYVFVFFMQGYFFFSIASSPIETGVMIASKFSVIKLLIGIGLPLVILCIQTLPIFIQYSLNRDLLGLSKKKSIQLLLILTIPILFVTMVRI